MEMGLLENDRQLGPQLKHINHKTALSIRKRNTQETRDRESTKHFGRKSKLLKPLYTSCLLHQNKS